MPLNESLQVEHVIPVNPPAGYQAGDPLDWNNLLLACGPCNRAKSNQPIDINTYYLPESHNTYLPFSTIPSPKSGHSIIIPKAGMTQQQIQKAERTIRLFDLDNIDERDKIVDIRSQKRNAALEAIEASKESFNQAKSSPNFNISILAQGIAKQAKAIGFFSLWYDAFHDESEVIKALIDPTIIKGTAQNCFDVQNNYRPIPRNPLDLYDPF